MLGDLGEELLGLDRGQRLGRLVEHQHLRLQGQRLGDLDELALGDAELADPGAPVEVGADRGELLGDPFVVGRRRRAARGGTQ